MKKSRSRSLHHSEPKKVQVGDGVNNSTCVPPLTHQHWLKLQHHEGFLSQPQQHSMCPAVGRPAERAKLVLPNTGCTLNPCRLFEPLLLVGHRWENKVGVVNLYSLSQSCDLQFRIGPGREHAMAAVNNMGNNGDILCQLQRWFLLSNTGIREPSITNAGCITPTSCLSSAAPGKLMLLASRYSKGFTDVTAVETEQSLRSRQPPGTSRKLPYAQWHSAANSYFTGLQA